MLVTPAVAWTLLTVPALAAGTQTSSAGGPLRLVMDPQRSEVTFHLVTTWHGVEGKTKELKGAITYTGPDPLVDARVSVEIAAASLETGNSRRDATMREDCLETGKYPTILFVSTGPPEGAAPEAGGAGVAFNLPGDLTIHGVTRRVTLPVKARREGEAWVASGELPVRLSDFAIPDPTIIFNKVQDVVTVSFTVTAAPESGPRD